MEFVNILLIILFLCIVIPLFIYMFMIDQRDKEAWYKNKEKREAEEKEDYIWIEKSFRPKMLKLMRTNQKKLVLSFVLFLIISIIVWLYFVNVINQMLQ